MRNTGEKVEVLKDMMGATVTRNVWEKSGERFVKMGGNALRIKEAGTVYKFDQEANKLMPVTAYMAY